MPPTPAYLQALINVELLHDLRSRVLLFLEVLYEHNVALNSKGTYKRVVSQYMEALEASARSQCLGALTGSHTPTPYCQHTPTRLPFKEYGRACQDSLLRQRPMQAATVCACGGWRMIFCG